MSVLLVSSQAPVANPYAAEATVEADPVLAHFRLSAEVDPGMLPRVLEHFAKRSLVPERWLSRRVAAEEGERLEVEAEAMMRDSDHAHYVGRCIAQIPGVFGCVVLTD
ncbi:hypothetical protein [Oceanibaculum pacificum]|nr:hypothetical protein [Oceanibaculum pacificum]